MDYCCVIVTFNRNELLLRNLEHIFDQSLLPRKIFIIDNHGSSNCENFLRENLDDAKISLIDYTYLDDNIGGAGGFSYGLKKAFEQNYEWFILMDDDGYPLNNDCFSNLANFCDAHKIYSNGLNLINCLVVAEDNHNLLSFGLGKIEKVDELNKLSGDEIFIKNEINPFNGTLISRGLVGKIGFPNADFFIKGDEVDYTNRAKNNDAQIYTILNALYVHPRIKGRKQINLLGFKFYVFVEVPIKEYYSIRNFTYSSINNKGRFKGLITAIYFYFKRVFCVLTLKCNKKETLKMLKRGFKDGKKGKLGKFN